MLPSPTTSTYDAYKSCEYPRSQLATRHAPSILPLSYPNTCIMRHVCLFYKPIKNSRTTHITGRAHISVLAAPCVGVRRDGEARRRFGERRGQTHTQFDQQTCDEGSRRVSAGLTRGTWLFADDSETGTGDGGRGRGRWRGVLEVTVCRALR